MTNVEFLQNELFSRYGNVKRARGCFLYTAKGERITDLYQENGRAILGWGGSSAFTMFKNTMNRGLTGSFCTDYSYRTLRAIEKLFDSKREVFYFSSKEKALKSAALISPEGISVYKPWSPYQTKWSEIDCIIFAPTFSWGENIYILAVKKELTDKVFSDGELFSSEAVIPAPLHAGITRSIYDLIKALQEREEKDWFLYDTVLTKYWERKGPYLFSKVPAEKYKDFALHCLDCGILVNPDIKEPSIVPFGADKGVFTKLKNNPFEF